MSSRQDRWSSKAIRLSAFHFDRAVPPLKPFIADIRTDPLRAPCAACHRGQLGDDRRPFVRELRASFQIAPQSCKLPVEAVEHRLPHCHRKCRRRLLAGFGAALMPKASHGRCAGRLGMIPCARRQRSERNRAFSRRSSVVMVPPKRPPAAPPTRRTRRSRR
jgi:hypothetical protein